MYSKHFSVRIIALISCRFSLDTLKMADKQKLIEVTYLDHCNGVPEFNQVSLLLVLLNFVLLSPCIVGLLHTKILIY